MRRASLLLCVALVACGYRPLRSSLRGSPRVRVTNATTLVAGNASASLAEELATGARAELAKWGALAADAATDRLRLELVRIEEHSAGVEVLEGRPNARGVRLRVTARGMIEGEGGAFETPDVEAEELVATPSDPLAWDAARGAAARALARRVGALVAREVLGIP